MAEIEYKDCRINYNPDNLTNVDITDIKGEHIEVSYASLQEFVAEIFKKTLIDAINAGDYTNPTQFVAMMNLFKRNS